MEESEIEILSSGQNLEEVHNILIKFLQKNQNVFTFPSLSEKSQRVILWTALFQHLQSKVSKPVHGLCLAVIRLLSRDKAALDNLICEKWITTLIDKAGLYNFLDFDETCMVPIERDITVEALKCLCNLAFNSDSARAICANSSIAQALISRIRVYKEIPYKDEIMLYDMKLLFILTALRKDVKNKIKNELHGMDYLTSCLNDLMMEATKSSDEAADVLVCFLDDNQVAIVCEILKAQFNLIMHPDVEDKISEEEESLYLKLMPVLSGLLCSRTSTHEKMIDLHINVANLLTSIPMCFYQYLTPKLNQGETAQYVYEDKNMDALQALVNLLHALLSSSKSTTMQYETLSPILTVMNKCARGVRDHRKYLRQVILPPLRDVSKPPEKGNTLRNQLCRLLTTPVTSVRDLVAELLFILCKEKVGRMVKYTGFGNAAGHLAQKGLLGGGRGAQYSSSSDDSDTEEYLEAQPNIDPVVGCTRPARSNPFEGMTEEQKEYEAMKLVNLFDKMVTEGVMRPARLGPDGRPQPVEHVLELRENPPNRSQS